MFPSLRFIVSTTRSRWLSPHEPWIDSCLLLLGEKIENYSKSHKFYKSDQIFKNLTSLILNVISKFLENEW